MRHIFHEILTRSLATDSTRSTPAPASSGPNPGPPGTPRRRGTPEARPRNVAVTNGSTVSLNPKIDPIERRPAPGIVTLRSAVPADLRHLGRWDKDPDVRSSLVDSDWHWDTELQASNWREWLIAEVDGRPIGFIQIIDPEHEESRTGAA